MGLCKCPKRKTTSHFCFRHCVNVCEHCILNNHTTCVVKSYTTWLKEASGTSISSSSSSVSASALCAVCQKQFDFTQKQIENLSSDFNDSSINTKSAVRLLCYHVVHARCLSVYVKKQLKEGKIIKCPSCARPLWIQQQEQSQDSNDIIGVDSNELSPVAFQLYKHLLDHGNWWGQALITNNGNVKDIEKYLLDDEDVYEEIADEESQQLFENQSVLKIKPQISTVSNSISSLTPVQIIHSPNINSYNYNNSELVNTTTDITTINHRNTHQTYQPTYSRHFNNNYGIDSVITPLQQQQQQQSVNMMTIVQGSDLSNRHLITSSTQLLLNDDNSLNLEEEQQDPSSKYRPKKFNNPSWFLSYQRLLQYFCGSNNKSEDNSTTRITVIIILCILIVVVLLVVITSYTRSNNEPFDNNSIDYGGGQNQENSGVEAHIKTII